MVDDAAWRSRFLAWSCARRLGALALAVTLAAWGLVASVVAPAQRVVPAEGESDLDFYRQVVDGIREGDSYYGVIDAQQAAFGFPTTPVVTVREPTLAWFLAQVSTGVGSALLIAIAVAALVLLVRTVDLAGLRRLVSVPTILLMALSLVVLVSPSAVVFHEVWSATLLVLGLVALPYANGRASMVAMLLAAMVRELVAPAMVLMACIAWRSGRRREAVEWAVAVAVFLGFYAWHAYQVQQHVSPTEVASPGWITFRLWPGVVDAFATSSLLVLVPTGVASVLVVLGVLGWVSQRGRVAEPVAGVVLVYVALLSVAGRPDTSYWGTYAGALVVAGVPLGIAAVFDLTRRPRTGETSRLV